MSRNSRPPPASLAGPHARAALAALAALFSGAALLAAIIVGVDLRITLAVATLLGLGLFAAVVGRAPPDRRKGFLLLARIGLVSGLAATVAYDASRWLLSQFDPSPYNPFEAVRAFGMMLTSGTAAAELTFAAGLAFHALNGTMFGVAYGLFLARFGLRSVRLALASGIGWGLFLEGMQLAVYPGWLSIDAFAEFATISAAGHLVYGAVLGLTCRALLLRYLRRRSAGPASVSIGP